MELAFTSFDGSSLNELGVTRSFPVTQERALLGLRSAQEIIRIFHHDIPRHIKVTDYQDGPFDGEDIHDLLAGVDVVDSLEALCKVLPLHDHITDIPQGPAKQTKLEKFLSYSVKPLAHLASPDVMARGIWPSTNQSPPRTGAIAHKRAVSLKFSPSSPEGPKLVVLDASRISLSSSAKVYKLTAVHSKKALVSLNPRIYGRTLFVPSSQYVDFAKLDNIRPMIGFEPHIYEAGKTHVSSRPGIILPVIVIRITCKGITHLNGRPSNKYHEFSPMIPPGYKLAIALQIIIYISVVAKRAHEVAVTVVDPRGELVNFRYVEITLHLHMRRVERDLHQPIALK
ncbi:hypothetical protein PR048_020364 [Dryococelus australis]|uniref:Uncharacterized protein n=1 Tax=Dryococelus australis TaxID=614101 RepID=A0ABQ9H6B3_9NEOP|nr:hypothetical protein PR048_020364 [Dryococelus australis]